MRNSSLQAPFRRHTSSSMSDAAEPGSMSPTPQHGKHRAGMVPYADQLISKIEDKLPPEQFMRIAALLKELKALAIQPSTAEHSTSSSDVTAEIALASSMSDPDGMTSYADQLIFEIEPSTSSSNVTAETALGSSMSDPAGASLSHEDQLVSETKDKLILEEHGEPGLGSILPTPQHGKDRAALLEDLMTVANRPQLRKMYYLHLRNRRRALVNIHSHVLEEETVRFLVETFGIKGKHLFVNNYWDIFCATSLCMFNEEEFKIVKGKEPEEVLKVGLVETKDLDLRYRLYHHDHLVEEDEWLSMNGLAWKPKVCLHPRYRYFPVMDADARQMSKAKAWMASGCYDLPPLYCPEMDEGSISYATYLSHLKPLRCLSLPKRPPPLLRSFAQ